MKHIHVFQDENATYCFIIGTSNAQDAENALREAENEWYGDDESKWEGLERRMKFSEFQPTKLYQRGEHIHWNKEELPTKRGRISVTDGFVAAIN